jgi:putative restriction endonuclease
MRVYVGVTDSSWYRYLAARPSLTEVNFWLPGGGRLNMRPGEPFAFKTHMPDNRIVGGGRFDGSLTLPVSDAWRIFGQGNGVDSLSDMRDAIGRYRKQPIQPGEDPVIGCVMLSGTVFMSASQRLPAPADWKGNIVRGKYYDVAGEIGGSIVEALFQAVVEQHSEDPLVVAGEVFGAPHLAATRVGQRPFQALVLDAYHRKCAITGDRIRPVLQAAHILPVSVGGQNRLDNGVLLRSDAHTLFDAGYLGIDPKLRLMVSPLLRSQFGNGEEFYGREGQLIDVPDRRADRPNRTYLEWHADTKFLRA